MSLFLNKKTKDKNTLFRIIFTFIGIFLSSLLLFVVINVKSTTIRNLFKKYDHFTDNKGYILGQFDENIIKDLDEIKNKSIVSLNNFQYVSQYDKKPKPYRMQIYATNNNLFEIGVPNIYLNDLNILNNNMVKGKTWSKIEDEIGSDVAVIDEESAFRIFKNTNPIGKPIAIGDINYKIVGISKKIDDFYLYEHDDFKNLVLYIPHNSYKKNFGNIFVNSYLVLENKDKLNYEVLNKKIMQIKKEKTKIDAVVTREIIVDNLMNSYEMLFNFINIIMLITFLISGFSLMNTMFFSIKERIREIGIRKAVGASNFEILIQFIKESLFFSLIGIMSGFLVSLFFSLIIFNALGSKIFLSFFEIVIVFIVLMSLSLLFSFFPALYASKIKIVDALKFD